MISKKDKYMIYINLKMGGDIINMINLFKGLRKNFK